MNTTPQTPNSDYPQNYANKPKEDIDLRRYLGLFLSNWYWFAGALFISLSLAYGINKYSESIYSVSASLLIKDDKNSTGLSGAESMIPGGDVFKNQQTLQNEIGILRSYSLNLRVMKELSDFHVSYVAIGRRGIAEKRQFTECPIVIVYDSLYKQSFNVPIAIKILPQNEFLLEINGNRNIKKRLKFGDRFKEEGFDFIVKLKEPGKYTYEENISNRYKAWFESPESLANTYRSTLNISPIADDATLVALSATGYVPTQIAEYLNKLMEAYIKQGLEYKNITADSTIKFINSQLKTISDSLSRAEKKLESFRLSNKLIDLSSEGNSLRSRLEKIEGEKTIVNLQLQYYKYLANYINSRNESGEIMSPSIMGISDPALIKLVDNLASLQFEKKQLKFNFATNLAANDLIESKIKDAIISLEENIRNNVNISENELKDVNERTGTVENEVKKLPVTERQLIGIQRTFELNNTVYTYMLEKRAEAGIAQASTISSNRVIDKANPENYSTLSPRRNRNYFLALIFGLLAPGVFIFLVYELNARILDKRDIEDGTDAPILGFVAHSNYKKDIPVISNPGSSLSESFRTIRTNLKYLLGGEKKAIISITSAISGEGKTFISTNLAAVFAMLGKKTLVVGLDLRKPRIHKIFPNTEEIGLSTFLIGESKFEDIILETGISNLFFVPTGPIPPNPSELIESERMKLFIKEVRQEFDFVFFDTPPIGIVTDAVLLGTFADVNLFVVRQRYSSKATLEYIQKIYEKKEINNPAIIVNDINISGYYGYGLRYGSGFYSGYGYDYGYGRYGSYHYGNTNNYYIEN